MVQTPSILEIPVETGYWLVRADGGKYYDDFFLNNFIAISDNEITLESIKMMQGLTGTTVDHYKDLYAGVNKKWTNQQISHAANRSYKFVEEMKIGDLVLVPSNKSTNFLIGIIESDLYEVNEEDISSHMKVHYAINPYLKRRKVKWLKEVSRREISEKLYWILSAHQTIFNLSKEKEYINQLLAPIYCQGRVFHSTLKISKKEGLNSAEWYRLHSLINTLADDDDEDVVIKSNVQSPGLIEFVTANPTLALAVTIVLGSLVIGEVNIAGFKVFGIVPFFQSLKKGKVDLLKAEKEIELLEEDKRYKKLENERIEFDLLKDKYLWDYKKIEIEAERVRNQLQISNFDAGRVLEHQKQMDNEDVQDADQSLEKIKKSLIVIQKLNE